MMPVRAWGDMSTLQAGETRRRAAYVRARAQHDRHNTRGVKHKCADAGEGDTPMLEPAMMMTGEVQRRGNEG